MCAVVRMGRRRAAWRRALRAALRRARAFARGAAPSIRTTSCRAARSGRAAASPSAVTAGVCVCGWVCAACRGLHATCRST
eukprot:166295-Prymnesium_polylepis.1